MNETEIKTKVCSGKHGCGKELPVEEFRIVTNHQISKKTGEKKAYKHICTCCKKCEKIFHNKHYKKNKDKYLGYQREWRKNNPEKLKQQRQRYRKSKNGKACAKRHFKKYYDKNQTELCERARKESIHLTDIYIRTALKGIKIEKATPDLIQAKRNQLKLYRYANQTNN